MSANWQPLLSPGVETGGPPESAASVVRLRPEGYSGLISYVKRFKMEADLATVPEPELPPGFTWVAWRQDLLETHADVLFRCFEGEIDTETFS